MGEFAPKEGTTPCKSLYRGSFTRAELARSFSPQARPVARRSRIRRLPCENDLSGVSESRVVLLVAYDGTAEEAFERLRSRPAKMAFPRNPFCQLLT